MPASLSSPTSSGQIASWRRLYSSRMPGLSFMRKAYFCIAGSLDAELVDEARYRDHQDEQRADIDADHLPRDVVERHAERHQPQHQHGEEDAEDRADPARDRDPAEDHHGNDVELPADADI